MELRADVEAVIQAAHDVDKTDGIHVKHCSRIGIVAQLGRVAGEAEDVLQPDRRSAQQIRLDAKNVAVAAGVMQNRLNAGVLLNLDAEALRAHASRGARRVRHIDGMHAELRQQARAFNLLGAVDALGRNDLHQRDECALRDQRADSRALRRVARAAFRWSTQAAAPEPAPRAWASMARMAERMARMWLGVVPQQPPTICAPAAMALRAKLAMYSGEQR